MFLNRPRSAPGNRRGGSPRTGVASGDVYKYEREITGDLQQMQPTGRQADILQDKCNNCTTNRGALSSAQLKNIEATYSCQEQQDTDLQARERIPRLRDYNLKQR
jgi:hypothetical protein